MLEGLQKSLKKSDERGNADWNEPQVIAKASIILLMGSQYQVRRRETINDDEKRLKICDPPLKVPIQVQMLRRSRILNID